MPLENAKEVGNGDVLLVQRARRVPRQVGTHVGDAREGRAIPVRRAHQTDAEGPTQEGDRRNAVERSF